MVRILIVEDDAELCAALRRTLESNGYAVATAGEGSTALKAIEETAPALVLTDIFMPGMEGLETIRTMKSKYPCLPVIVMTGAIDRLYLNMGKQFGAVHGLQKPFSTDELLLAIEGSFAITPAVKGSSTVYEKGKSPARG